MSTLACPQRGVTVIELLIVVTIGAILAAVAVPGMRSMYNSTQQSTTLGQIVSDLNQARAEAIKRNARMLMCVRNVAGTGCGVGTDWAAGWVVCSEDPAAAGSCRASTATDPNPVVVRAAIPTSLTLTAGAALVRFTPNSASNGVTLTLTGTWSGAPTRTVTVATTGNITRQ